MEKKEDKIETFVCSDGNIATRTNGGNWTYKSVLVADLFKKGTKILKKKEHDKPRYKIIVQYEDSYKKQLDNYLYQTTIALVKKMKQLVK